MLIRASVPDRRGHSYTPRTKPVVMNTERVALIGVTLLLVVGGVAMVLAPTVVVDPA